MPLILILFLTFSALPLRALGASSSWLQMESGLEDIDISKAWYLHDLSQAVFIRKSASATPEVKNPVMNVTENISHMGNRYFFYNMNSTEVETFLSQVQASPITSPNSSAQACQNSANQIGLLTQIKNFLSGETIKNLVGCSARSSPTQGSTVVAMKTKEFATFLSHHWEQLRTVFTFLPQTKIHPEELSQVLCTVFEEGAVFLSHSLAFGAIGAGVASAVLIGRFMLGLNRVLRVKRHSPLSPTRNPPEIEILQTQQKILSNLKKGAEEIIDKGQLRDPKLKERYWMELKITLETELAMHRDLLLTLQKIEVKGSAKTYRGLDIQKIKLDSLSRIEQLSKAVSNKGTGF